MSQFRYFLSESSSLKINKTYIPTAYNIDPGNDILAYDRELQSYVGIKGDTYNPNISGFVERYDTNNDIIVGISDGYIHACACNSIDSVYGNTAASHCFYKLSLPVDVLNGSKSFDMNTGNVTRTFTGTVDTIVSKMQDTSNATAGGFGADSSNTFSNIFFVEKIDETTIGIGRGDVLVNRNNVTITFDDSTFINTGFYNGLTLEDMTLKATADMGVYSGDNFNDLHTQYSNTIHKDFRTQSCITSGYTSPDISTVFTPSGICYCNNGQTYSYIGLNFSLLILAYRNYSSGNKFIPDGVNGSATTPSSWPIMNLATFDSCINSSATGDAKLMYDYYHELLNSNNSEIKAKREKLESMYGSMQAFTDSPLYATYIMSHIIDVDSNSGSTQVYRNQGKYITDIKGRVMNVDYNDKYVPAYPPEYGALQYGNNNSNSRFKKGSYYYPELFDLGLIFRDDINIKYNDRLSALSELGISVGNPIGQGATNNMYLGSCVEGSNTNIYVNNRFIMQGSNRRGTAFYIHPFIICSNF